MPQQLLEVLAQYNITLLHLTHNGSVVQRPLFVRQNLRSRAVDLDRHSLGRSKKPLFEFFLNFSPLELSSDIILYDPNLRKYSVLSDDITTHF